MNIDGGIGFGMVNAEFLVLGSVKIMFVVAGLLYVAFAVLVLRQIYIMKKTVITSFSPVVVLLGYAHLIMAILLFVFFLGL